ncbi:MULTISPECIES: chitin disaccharide deacetylase [unclassified Clostridioides]|uniref:chitin disaccharide deacetylase n=1 Tax=unclassified Clostridioides TaxID=2635829 RepID=UPI001D12A6B2|nr:chitin disaccharide deacetylase [Clostridioides sp. ZZV14-6150]MCC0660750.1 chitin disaccharide deacetylase [Clostridioides sp. ZZV14-6154]MCC0717385.1 chitin disaccharide deacetylase [Clostridioides sp. ZZV14-6105]MCC0721488.1 chitin disaccharide deacetylase [Clostridioides sp. ZZV14-6104]MCC0727881.1 chitin disaccharide deacetylase [Clostridioides sp. ZZV14-6045]MCC0729778.1 chitin disaccharide deacetylase [Clostridioides sp. ZZV14-6048]MCC0734425.1 chitin disaccharide deacetylase [Clost
MTKIIINADDFGYCEAVNYGIISAHNNGIVKSTSMMANMPGVEHGVKLLKENRDLNCGVHMTLSCGRPLLSNLKTIVDKEGFFIRRITDEIIKKMDYDEIYRELCAQIDRVKELGIDISHLDSHHHIHTLVNLKPIIEKIVNKYNLPIRGGFEYDLEYSKIVPLIDSFYKENVSEEYFIKNIEEIMKYDVVDIMSHPAFLDDYILNSTSYAIDRTKEHKILTSKKVREFLRENGLVISSYRDI